MKIGMLTSMEERCGISVYSADLADGLRKLVDLDLVSTWDKESPWEAYLMDSAERLNACDVVHIQHEYSFWGSVLPGQNRYFEQAASIRKPIVMTAHTLDPAAGVLGLNLPGSAARKLAKRILSIWPPYRRVIERRTFEVAERIIIHDPRAMAVLKGRGIAESRIRMIPMGVPPANPDLGLGEEFVREHQLEGKLPIVVFGFVRPGRGYETVLDALPNLDPRATLVIAGGPQTSAHGAYLAELTQDVSDRGLGGRVVITGFLSDEQVAGAMRAASVVLLPQLAGTGSYSVQVAYAYGRPILASDLPCFTYPEQTEGALITFRAGDAGDLTARLKTIFEDDELRARLGQGALDYAGRHSWDAVAAQTVEAYRELT